MPAAPEAKTELPLRIHIWDEEVTVDFDHHHTHFGRWNPDEGDDRHQSALLYVRAALEEKIAAASWWQEGSCAICLALPPNERII